ncbi:MAG: hypothetical protein IPG78_14600 [Ignavibacteria bacterium]|nr:hypothetical protein [Ignavibacteria bacterium]MBL0107281.1 hypothetical protein [Ignavibacteria bacterium]
MDSILKEAKKISLEGSKAERIDFCSAWPPAKQGLELLRSIVTNPIAKGAISLVIAAGDAVSSQICNK